jgi:hypothetical protein
MDDLKIIEVQRGRDGKRYPLRPVPPDETERARRLAHNLVCRDRLSTREAQRVMLEDHGVRRSLGSIHSDLAGFECDHCAAEPEPGAR